jgi:mRNA-degrading endonuclease YafQ of YafQ-DinJ toxin-antitoxin module
MSYQLVFTDSYLKRAKKFAKKHPELKQQYLKTLQILELNPFHPALRLHKLSGRLQDVYSVSINLSYRITIELMIENEQIIPINVGTHQEVYRS